MKTLTKIDFIVLDFIHKHMSCAFLDFFMPKITRLGDGGFIWATISLILICTKSYRKAGVMLLVALAVGILVVNVVLKPIIARPRPCWIKDTILLIKMPRDFSFPSGHALSSIIAATTLVIANTKFGYFAVPIATLIAFSRLYLYVHFPSDILCAVVLGVAIAFVVGLISLYLGPTMSQIRS